MSTNFTEDFRKEKPSLHRLYVEYAVGDLAAIDKAIKDIDARSHTSLSGVLLALMEERKKLVQESASFAEADKLLKIAQAVSNGEELPDDARVAAKQSVCKHCQVEISYYGDGLWRSNEATLPQYCYADPQSGSRLHEPEVVDA